MQIVCFKNKEKRMVFVTLRDGGNIVYERHYAGAYFDNPTAAVEAFRRALTEKINELPALNVQ